MYRSSSGNRSLNSKKRSMKSNTRNSLLIHPKKWCKERSSSFGLSSSKPTNSYSSSSRWWCLEEVKFQVECRVAQRSTCLWTDHGNMTTWEICQGITIAWTIIRGGRAERRLFHISIPPSKEIHPHKMRCLIILDSTQEVDLGRLETEKWKAG